MFSNGEFYRVSEYSTGFILIKGIRREEDIKKSIKEIYNKIGVDKIKQRIAETIKKHGVANE